MGRSALWHARHNGAKECANILLNSGLPTDYGLIPTTTPSSIDYSTTFQLNNTIITTSMAKLRRQSDLIDSTTTMMNQNGFKPINRVVNDAFHALPTSNI